MKAFMGDDFLLDTETARTLFREGAQDTPILIGTAISPRRKFMRTASQRISRRYGWAAITTNGAPCAPMALRSHILLATRAGMKNLRLMPP